MITVRPKPGKFFFDAKPVTNAADRANIGNLRKFGAFVRTKARQSLHYAKEGEKSQAGLPPLLHKTFLKTKVSRKTGERRTQSASPFKEFIFFDVDPRKMTVVIGPALLPGKIGKALPALEYGGLSTVIDHQKEVAARISPHPTMGPALEEVITEDKIPNLWRNSVK